MQNHINDMNMPPISLVNDLLIEMALRDRVESLANTIERLERCSAETLEKPNIQASLAQLRGFVDKLVASERPWDDKVWSEAVDIVDKVESEERQPVEKFFASLDGLAKSLESDEFFELSDRVADIHDNWVDAANRWMDEFLLLRADLSREHRNRTPRDKMMSLQDLKKELESPDK